MELVGRVKMEWSKFRSIKNLISIGQTEDAELFNNIGHFDDAEGRLTVWLVMNPTPRVRWEFEFAKGKYNYDSLHPKKLTSWDGANPALVLENSWSMCKELGLRNMKSYGYASRALFGEVNEEADHFTLYFPNTNFLRESTNYLGATVLNLENDHPIYLGATVLNLDPIVVDHQPLVIEIDNDWYLSFHTGKKVLNWLDPEAHNRGSMITCKACMTRNGLALSLIEANSIFMDLCRMLTYINAGYIQPVYVVAEKFLRTQTGGFTLKYLASLAQSCLISPQEELGQPCIAFGSFEDLSKFISCFPCFQRMLESQHWDEKWELLIEWYFQALPKPFGRSRSPLQPVIANALGTLLEHLAKIILVDEGDLSRTKFAQLRAKERIPELLSRIGIQENKTLIDNFIAIRNDSTHSEQRNTKLSLEEESDTIWNAIQWVDEVILWRLGYSGRYYNRVQQQRFGSPIQPRYNLELRNPSW